MFKNLLNVLLGNEEDKLNDEDENIAVAALCVRVAKSDNVYDQSEISTVSIKKIISNGSFSTVLMGRVTNRHNHFYSIQRISE